MVEEMCQDLHCCKFAFRNPTLHVGRGRTGVAGLQTLNRCRGEEGCERWKPQEGWWVRGRKRKQNKAKKKPYWDVRECSVERRTGTSGLVEGSGGGAEEVETLKRGLKELLCCCRRRGCQEFVLRRERRASFRKREG